MLKVKNISIQYYQPVLNIEELQFSIGLHIIEGESGSGKSSLLRCLALCEKTCQEYIWNQKTVQNIHNFKKEHIGFLNQHPIFIDALTINDHIQLMNKVYRYQNVDNYVQKLELTGLLKKYPSQLSGGEKTRLGLLLLLLKQPEILILDEPTSSLDLSMTKRVIQILKDYSRHHIVIVASHDQELINHGDNIYTIENQTIHCKKPHFNKDIPIPTHKAHYLSAFFLSTRLLKKHGIYTFFTYIFISLSLFITSSGLSLLLSSSVAKSSPLTSIYENEILIYKPITQSKNLSYSSEGIEYPLTNDEVSRIQNIPHIQSIYPDYSLNMGALEKISDPIPLDNSFQEANTMTVSLDAKENTTPVHSSFSQALLCSYNESIDYSQDIETQFSYDPNGIYISQALANELQIIAANNQYYLTFYIMIPTYQGYGDAYIPFQNEDGSYQSEGYPVLRLFGKYQKVTLPINGILKKVNMGISPNTEFNYNKIFIPQTYIQQLIKENAIHKDITYYWSDHYNQYMTFLEKEDSSQQMMICKPYQPTIYKAQIDSIENLPHILEDIHQLGLTTINANINLSQIQQYSQNTNETLFILSTLVFIILIIIYNMTLYLKKETNLQIYYFLQSYGYSFLEIRTTIRNLYFYNSLFSSFLTSLFTLIYLYVIGPLFQYPIHLHSIIFFIIPTITFFTIFIIPYFIFYFIIRKEGAHDSIKSHSY